MTEPLDEHDPREIGPYAVVGRLGAGGMGQVYLGRAPDGQLCAVKVIHPGLAHDEQFRARFGREVDTARRVTGPHVARVLAADPDAPLPWLAAEYVPGPSLEHAVTAGRPLPERSVRIMAAQLFGALATVHASGVVHRDLKPSNIMLAPDGAKLIDFGIARAVEGNPDHAHRDGRRLACLHVARAGRRRRHRAASDVFSLAAVLVFASTGVGPYGEGTPAALLLRAADATPRLDGVPESMRPMLELCLAKGPAARPTAAMLAATLSAAARTDAGPWLPPAITAPPARSTTRRSTWLVAAGVAMAVAVTATVVAISSNSGTDAPPVTSQPTAIPIPTPVAPPSVFIRFEDDVVDVAFTPDSLRAFVVLDNGVDVVDMSTNSITTKIALSAPRGIAITPDGTRAYVGLRSGFVQVLDTTTYRSIASVPVGQLPYGIAFSPDGGRAYVANVASGTVFGDRHRHQRGHPDGAGVIDDVELRRREVLGRTSRWRPGVRADQRGRRRDRHGQRLRRVPDPGQGAPRRIGLRLGPGVRRQR